MQKPGIILYLEENPEKSIKKHGNNQSVQFAINAHG
jgi:hypothetical protein